MAKKEMSNIRKAWLEFKRQGSSSKKWKAMLRLHEKLIYAEARKLRSHVRVTSAVDRLIGDGYFALLDAARYYRGSDANFRSHCRRHIRSTMTKALQYNLISFLSELEPRTDSNSEIGRVLKDFVTGHTMPQVKKSRQRKTPVTNPKHRSPQ